jgi:hypothetical protein
MDLDFYELGSTTFKREQLQKGFEPDSAFYFGPDASAAEGNTRPESVSRSLPPSASARYGGTVDPACRSTISKAIVAWK